MRHVCKSRVACLQFVFSIGRLAMPREEHGFIGTPRSFSAPHRDVPLSTEVRKRNGAVVMRKFMMLTIVVSMICNALADTETVGGYTWTYYIRGDTAEISGSYYGQYTPSVSPTPTGAVTIPSTLGGKPVTSIGWYALYGCSCLTSVTIPDGVTIIEYSAFYGCSGLTSVEIPDSVTSIGSSAFYDCSSLTSATIPDSVTRIGDWAFYGCSGLTSVTIPNSVTSIGNYAFSRCSGLTSVMIPDSVTSIGGGAFCGCSGLMYFSVGCDNVNYKSVNGLLLSKDGESLVAGVNGDVTIPDSVRSIGGSAFSGCSELTSVTIPGNVTSIGGGAFSGCSSLTLINIPNSVTNLESYIFSGCSSLTDVIIPNSIMKIGDSAFDGCSGLTSVTIPDSVTKIGYEAFKNCSGLITVVVGKGVTELSYRMFGGCGSLESITIPFVGITRGNAGYDSHFGYIFGQEAYAGGKIQGGYCIPTSLKTVVVTDETQLDFGAFSWCNGLTQILIPDTLTNLDTNVFYGCNAALFDTQTIPGVKLVDGWAVGYENGLCGDVDLTDARGVGASAFSMCSGMTSVIIGEGVTSLGAYAFECCDNFTNVTICATNLVTIGDFAFPAFRSQQDDCVYVFVSEKSAPAVLPQIKRGNTSFDGWWTEPEGGEKVENAAAVVPGKAYYAHWSKPVISRIELAIPTPITVGDDDYQKILHNDGSYGINPAFIAAVYDQNGQSIENWEEYGIIEFYRYDKLYATHSYGSGTILNDGSYFYGLPAGSWLVKVVGDGEYFEGEATATLQVYKQYYSGSEEFSQWSINIVGAYESPCDYEIGTYNGGVGNVKIDVDNYYHDAYNYYYDEYNRGWLNFSLNATRECNGVYGASEDYYCDYDGVGYLADSVITHAGMYHIQADVYGEQRWDDEYYASFYTTSGQLNFSVYLAPADFDIQDVSAVNDQAIYTGAPVSPLENGFDVVSLDSTSCYIEDTSFTDAGTHVVRIGAINNGGMDFYAPDESATWKERIVKDENGCPIFDYVGVVDVPYTILPRPVAAGQISFSMPQNLVYDGTAKVLSNISITNDFNGVELVEGTNYDVIYTDNVMPGRATAAIVCKGNYTGTITKTFEILPASFGLAADGETGGFAGESGSIAGYEGEYDGEGHGAAADVAGLGEVMTRYALNEDGPYFESLLFTNVCDETVWVELSAPGYNSFTGAVKVAITPRSIENAVVTARNIVEGPGRQPVFSLDIRDDGIGRTLVEGVDYCTNVENDDASGTTTVTVTGMGNYTGERVVETAYVKTRNIGGVNWRYWPVDGSVWLVSINQSSGEMQSVVAIPDEIDGLPVREVPDGFFAGWSSVETVVVGTNVVKFGNMVFSRCTALKYVVFSGDAPSVNQNWIGGADGGESEFISVFTGASSDVKIVAAKKDGGWGESWPTGEESRQVATTPLVDITPFSGKKSGRMAVTMTHDCEIPESKVMYTIDGTEPTAASTHYEKRFSINVTGLVSVKAAVFLGGVRISDVAETRYSPVLNDVLNIGDIIAKPGSAPLFFDLDSSNQWWSDEVETSYDGTPSMKSGRIGNESSSWMSATFTGAGVLEFSWKASCEEDNLGEFFYDHAVCELDGVEVAWLDGVTEGWVREEIAVESAGEHTVTWIYVKDVDDDTIYPGADCVWVDGVKFSYPVYISFAAGDGTGEPPEPLMGAIGYEVKLPDQGGLTCAKHGFAGWSDGERVYGAGASYTVGAADVTLTAVWSDKVLEAPVIDVAETYDEEATTVTIDAAACAAIYYTIDGGNPSAETGVLYEGAFQVAGTTTIKAIAVADDWFDSAVAEAVTTRSWTSLEECLGASGFALATGGDANWIGDAAERCVKTAANAGGWLTAAFDGAGVATYMLKEGAGEWVRHDEVFPDGGTHILRWEGVSVMLKGLELLPVVSVSFHGDEAVLGDMPPTIYTAEGRYVEISGGAGLAKPKHEFAGWSTGENVLCGGDLLLVGSVDVVLEATWTERHMSDPVIDAPATYEADSATVTITADADAIVYYTTDGSNPSEDSSARRHYQGAFAVEGSATIKAIAVREDFFDSEVVSLSVTRLPWTFGECLNWSEQDFATGGDAQWMRVKDVSGDGFALRSGKVENKGKSILSTIVEGAGAISFSFKTSSEFDVETGEPYDGLVLSVDGRDVTEIIGGELDWRRMTVPVAGDGLHCIEWRYEKDKRDSAGADCAWLDVVSWTPSGAADGVAIQVNGAAVEFETAADGKTRTAEVAAGTAAEDVKVFVGGVDVTAGFKVAVEGTTATVVLKEPYETARSEIAPYQAWSDNGDGSVTMNVEVVPGLYYAADSAATIEAE